jgi:hypothetical protein
MRYRSISLIHIDPKSVASFRRLLKEPDIIQHHLGRFVLIKNGRIYENSFETYTDAEMIEFDDDWILFEIPKSIQ